MQSDIITQLKFFEYISLINKLVFFFQFVIVEQNRHKFFFIIYREKEQLNVVAIKFKNSFVYVQQVINKQLRFLRDFCKMYIDNIVFFFKFFANYFNYLRCFFTKFVELQDTFNSKKICFNYFSIILLKKKIDIFDLSIIEKRIIAIKSIQFFKNLKILKTYLNLTNY